MIQEYQGVNFAIRQKSLPGHVNSWFNMGIMRRWYKPVLFSLGIVAAGLIATNPKFVLPFKYNFIKDTPLTVQSGVAESSSLESITNLPAGILPENQIPPVATEPSEASASVATKTTKTKTPTAWVAGNINIPSLKISTPLVYVSDRTDKAFQLGLQQGVVQYPGTALPGQLGNVYIFGNSSDYSWAKGSYKTIFAKLPDIKIGSEIKITDGAGKVYTYKIKSTAIVLPTEVKYLSQYNYQKKILTLQTCYPVGTALKRFLTIAELVE